MRTYGRTYNESGTPTWQVIETDANGHNDFVYLQTLINCLKLNLGESPFWASYGIPAQQSVITQIFPDYYMWQTQQQFAQYFASLTISRTSDSPPSYEVDVLTNQGVIVPTIDVTAGVPQ